jgi:hypothetical protein
MKHLKPYKLYESISQDVKSIIDDSLIDLSEYNIMYNLNVIRDSGTRSVISIVLRIRDEEVDTYFDDYQDEEVESKISTFKWKDVVGSITELVSQISDYYELTNCGILGEQSINTDRFTSCDLVYKDDKWVYDEIFEDSVGDFDPANADFDVNQIAQITLMFKHVRSSHDRSQG